jgi:hypothetical protein
MELNPALQARRRASLPEAPTDDLENKTFFTVWARWPGQTRLFSVEWEMIETEAEAVAVLRENRHAVVVFRHDPDVPRRDVSEDVARQWLRERADRGYDHSALPDFIARHLTSDDIADITRRTLSLAAE